MQQQHYRYGLEMTRIRQRTEYWERVVLKKPSGFLTTKTNFSTSHILPRAGDKQPNRMFYTKLKKIFNVLR